MKTVIVHFTDGTNKIILDVEELLEPGETFIRIRRKQGWDYIKTCLVKDLSLDQPEKT